jgi:hypothetical protein
MKNVLPKALRVSTFGLMLFFVSRFAECYKPVTKNQMPDRIKTVAVPAFQLESQALRYKIGSRFTMQSCANLSTEVAVCECVIAKALTLLSKG